MMIIVMFPTFTVSIVFVIAYPTSVSIHETMAEQVRLQIIPGIWVDHPGEFASSARTSYLRLVISYHVGRHTFQKSIHNAFAHYADHFCLHGVHGTNRSLLEQHNQCMHAMVDRKFLHDLS